MEFLVEAEIAQIDRSALSSREKFLARLLVLGWHISEFIANSLSKTIPALETTDIIQWFANTELIRHEDDDLYCSDSRSDAVSNSGLLPSRRFLCRIVIQARSVLIRISQAVDVPVDNLTLEQMLPWIEEECARQRDQGEESSFLQV